MIRNIVGVMDRTIDLFEGQYPVPNGISYNSSVLFDEKIAVMDAVDAHFTGEWLRNLQTVLAGKRPDYLIISHMEPDHSGGIASCCKLFPEMTLVGTAKALAFLDQFTDESLPNERITVAEGRELSLGKCTLRFLTAPMVHWPEVMITYIPEEKMLFSADAFGCFGFDGASLVKEDYRRYYTNIVGKYGAQVQAVLKKAASLDIERICPLHGPDLTGERLGEILELYQKWSTWTPEDDGVLVAVTSLHGHTEEAAHQAYLALQDAGVPCTFVNLGRQHVSTAVSAAFRHSAIFLASVTYDGALPQATAGFLSVLKAKGLQGRRVQLMENGTWAPMSGKLMRAALEEMKNMTIAEQTLSLRSMAHPADLEKIRAAVLQLAGR